MLNGGEVFGRISELEIRPSADGQYLNGKFKVVTKDNPKGKMINLDNYTAREFKKGNIVDGMFIVAQFYNKPGKSQYGPKYFATLSDYIVVTDPKAVLVRSMLKEARNYNAAPATPQQAQQMNPASSQPAPSIGVPVGDTTMKTIDDDDGLPF